MMRCGQCGAPVREAAGGSPFAYDYDPPPADRSAKAVAEPVGYVNPKALVELKKLGRMGSCNLWNTPSDTCTVGLYTAPPAQPASPGPLQPGASRVTDAMIKRLREEIEPDLPQEYEGGIDWRAALEAALSADRSAKAVAWRWKPTEAKGDIHPALAAFRHSWLDIETNGPPTTHDFEIANACERTIEYAYCAPPAQPASPGPLQPGAYRAAAEAVISDIADRSGFGAISDVDAEVAEQMVTELAEVIREALSADHDAKETKP